ncbi:hypothetical protein FB446DRAFT_130865 [Lentinula raphanica]|nr:hypothetical protein FB446DRAFT_130865 [Lentinula raphanica]
MDAGETHCFQGIADPKQEVQLLTIACRFVPYDQWLVTHVDSSWTINEVKLWVLAKCAANSPSRSGPASVSNLPPIHPPTRPKKKTPKRPASPIVFAEFSPASGGPSHSPTHNPDGQAKADKAKRKQRRSRGRPISPITFAPIGVDPQDDSEDGSATGKEEGEVIGMGYEEDDEWDSQEDAPDIDELELDPNPRMGRRANRNQYLGFYDRRSVDRPTFLPAPAASRTLPSKTLVNPASFPKGCYTTYHPGLVTVIRFSTGQILERHYTISDYEIKPYELLEIHRLGVVTKLPREITSEYIEPYWEGWVKALRVVFRAPRPANEPRSQAREPGRSRETSTKEANAAYTETARKTMEVLAGGRVAAFAPADVALGIRRPSSSRVKKSKRVSGTDLDIHTSLLKSTKLAPGTFHDMNQSGSALPSGSNTTQNTAHHGNRSKAKGGKLEWRERWLFIKNGVLHLKKDNSELSSTTTQVLPLDSLTEIGNADQLGTACPSPPSQWIVCAKFKAPITTTKNTVSDARNTAYTQPSQSTTNSANSNHPPMPNPTSQSSVIPSKRSSLLRSGSLSHPRDDSNHSSLRGSNLGTNRPMTSPTSASRPKIMLQINPLPPPAPSKLTPVTEPSPTMNTTPKDKGKNKVRVTSEVEIMSGPASENPSEVHSEEEGAVSDNEGDTADLAEDRRKQKIPSTLSTISDRRHPHISIESDADTAGSGGTLSSPIFAHSEDDSSFDGFTRSYKYGYDYGGGTPEWLRKDGDVREKDSAASSKRGETGYEDDEEANTNYVVVDDASGVAENPGPSRGPKAPRSMPSKRSGHHGEKPDPDVEWIVLDLGDDFAFKSFLRVIHRHAPHVIDSSFLSNLHPFQIPRPPTDSVPAAPAPTPTFTTSFPIPGQPKSPPLFGQWAWNASTEQQRRPVIEEISPISTAAQTNPNQNPTPTDTSSNLSSSNVAANSEPQTPVSPADVPRDSRQFRLPPSPSVTQSPSITTFPLQSPSVSAALRQFETKRQNILSSQQKTLFGTFGLPYPEWRFEVVTKAQRAGLGELTKAMDQFLWGDNPGLTLLTKELGLSIAPMELIRSPSIQTSVGDRRSVQDEGDSTEDAASVRKQRKRKDRKLTLEQENIAIGLNYPKTENPSSPTLVGSSHTVPSSSNIRIPGSHIEEPRSTQSVYVDVDSSQSGEESSDAEWLGWWADLHRQAKLQREEDERMDRLEKDSIASSSDTNHFWDFQQQDDHRRYQEEQRAYEPSGVVTSSAPSPAVVIMNHQVLSTLNPSDTASHRTLRAIGSDATISVVPSQSGDLTAAGPSTILTSPSSNESLNKFQGRRLSFGLSPSDPPSSATSPSLSQAGHSVEPDYQPSSSRPHKHRRQISGMVRDGPNLSHYASTGLIGATTELLRELELENSGLTSARRPSMPVIGSVSSTIRAHGPSSVIKDAEVSRGLSEPPMRVDVPRRSSTTGSISSVSANRSSSMLSKAPGLLRKKGSENVKASSIRAGEQERERIIKHERPGKQKEKLWKGKGKEQDTDLTVQELSGQDKYRRAPSTSQSSMHSRMLTSTSIAQGETRHSTKSGQHSRAGEDGKRVKKEKKTGLAEKFLQGLESKLDFVDAK